MEELLLSYKETGAIHHAHLVVGDPRANAQSILDFSETFFGRPAQGNPDITILEQDQLTILDARELRILQANLPVVGTKRLFIIAVRSITLDAQHALLKVLEEPAPHAHFFIALSTLHGILRTLRSRALLIYGKPEELPFLADARTFLASYPNVRLEILEPTTKGLSDDDEKVKKEARERVDLFLRSLITAFNEQAPTIPNHVRQTYIQEFTTAQRYMRNVASAPKLLLEHLALVLPIVG